MTKALLGSLTVAPVELPRVALPVAKRASRDAAMGVPSVTPLSLMRSKLGSYVQPFGVQGFVAHSVQQLGAKLTVTGVTASGKDIRVQMQDPRADLMPRWARRIASIMRVAWENEPWDNLIKATLAGKHLPVDETVNWNSVLNNLFTRYGFDNPTEREDAIQQAILTTFVVRQSLDKFDPNRSTDATKDLPLEKRLTSYIIQLFHWQLTGKDEVGDQMHTRLKHELTVLDKPGEEGAPSMADKVETDHTSPEDAVLDELEVNSYADFRAAFADYVVRYREGDIPGRLLTLMDLLASAEDGTQLKQEWEAQTGTSYSYMRNLLAPLRNELLHFAQSVKAPDTKLTRLINELRARTKDVIIEADAAEPGGDKSAPMAAPSGAVVAASLTLAGSEAPVQVTPERRFMAMLTAAVRQIVHGKTAAPKVVDHSILYFKLSGDPNDPRCMVLSFYSPKLRINPGSGTYRIEVGDWAVDKSLPQARIKQQLSTFVIPMMRGDVLDEDHDLLEKVIRKLRAIVWENAVEYFQIPTEEKASWRNMVKMDLQRVQDAKVTVRDESHGIVEVAASLRESSKGRLAHRMAACSECEQDDGDERWTAARPRPRWNEEKQTWESTDDGQRGGLLGGQPADYGSKRQISIQAAGGDLVDTPVYPRQQLDRAAAADANGHAPESTPSEVSSATKAGALAFDPTLHDPEAEPSITHMAMHLESSGIDPTSDNMHAAVEGFTTARDAHHKKEAAVSATPTKFAALKRIAADNAEDVADALTTIEDNLREQLNNISVMKENFGITEPVGEIKEGVPAEVKPVEGEQRLAGFKRFANEAPEAIQEALGEFYLAMDEVMAMTENLADNLDVDLPTDAPAEEGTPVEVEDPADNPDAGLHGEMPTGGDGAPEDEKKDKDDEEKA